MLYNIPTSNEFLRSSQKFCPSFHYEEKWKSYWVYNRAIVAPTYPIGAGIRSNVVPLVDDECCKESERLSVENAQYEHDEI